MPAKKCPICKNRSYDDSWKVCLYCREPLVEVDLSTPEEISSDPTVASGEMPIVGTLIILFSVVKLIICISAFNSDGWGHLYYVEIIAAVVGIIAGGCIIRRQWWAKVAMICLSFYGLFSLFYFGMIAKDDSLFQNHLSWFLLDPNIVVSFYLPAIWFIFLIFYFMVSVRKLSKKSDLI